MLSDLLTSPVVNLLWKMFRDGFLRDAHWPRSWSGLLDVFGSIPLGEEMKI